MELLLGVVKASPELRSMLRSPVIRPDKKLAVLKGVFEREVQPLTFGFFKLLAHNRRERYLEEIARQYIGLYKQHMNITTVRIRTAVAVSKELRDKIVRNFEKYTGGKIDLHEEVDEHLIGGVLVNWEDKQFDATLRKKLILLKKEFDKNLYKREF
jgi:F-type H+-transporting ATPase subunit delta